MKRVGLLLATAAVVALTACGDDPAEPGDSALEPFVGFWAASVFEFRPVSQAQADVEPVDLVRFGVLLTLEVEPDGRFTISQEAPGIEPGIDRGRLEIEAANARLSLIFDEGSEDPLSGSFVFSEGQRILTITLPDARFDFDGDGEDAPARARIVFERQ